MAPGGSAAPPATSSAAPPATAPAAPPPVRPTNWAGAPGVLWRRLGTDDVLLLPTDTDGAPLVLRNGAELWQLLRQPRSCRELATCLAHGRPSAIDRIGDDLVPLLGALADEGVVRPVP